jgi:hypothetical protein
MGVSVGEFAVVGMASFDLVWFEWLRGVQARDCGDSGWCIVRDCGWLGAWLLGSLPFNSISVRSRGVCVLAGWCSRRQGEDQWCVFGFEDVGWRCVLCWCFRALVLSFFPLLLLPRGSILVLSEVCVRGSSTSSSTRFAGVK